MLKTMTVVTATNYFFVTIVTGMLPLLLLQFRKLLNGVKVMSKNFKVGLILILAGIFMLLSQLGVIPGVSILYLLGIGFIAVYAILGARREYGYVGFLIPGTILLAIALFASLGAGGDGGEINPGFFFLFLSLSFLTVFLVHTYWFRELGHGDRFWPLYPAAGLLVMTGIVGMATTGKFLQGLNLFNYLWIIALIAFGAWLVIKGIKTSKS
jgi:hypothetical protein